MVENRSKKFIEIYFEQKMVSFRHCLIGCMWRMLLIAGVASNEMSPVHEDGVDILVAGGSLAALASVITIANLTKDRDLRFRVVWLEPTDWPGGQLTSSSVPPDFGNENSVPANLPASFVALLSAVTGPQWATNPGLCWVSYKCFQSQLAVDYIRRFMGDHVSIELLNNSVVKSSERSSDGKRIVSVTAIQRFLNNQSTNANSTLSEDITDWYSLHDSSNYLKRIVRFTNPKVVIEGTEFSDILMTADISSVTQGVETPAETSDTFDSSCGQSTVFPFHINYNPDSTSGILVPQGSDDGLPFTTSGLSWQQVWTYRRVKGTGDHDSTHVFPGEISNQNLDNDYKSGYVFLTMDKARAELQSSSGWFGGLNVPVLASAEQRSYGWYNYLVNTSTSAGIDPQMLSLNITQVGAASGLSKMPYLRDTRRVQYGIGDFRLTYADLNYSNPDDGGLTARHFPDTVAIGVYHYADIHGLKSGVCEQPYPEYITCCDHPVKPYYIPFRALTSRDMGNLLIAGKGMAQSFLANAATRLHPSEWSSGVAAGAAAVFMIEHKLDSTMDVYKNVNVLQDLLTSSSVGSPLTWTL